MFVYRNRQTDILKLLKLFFPEVATFINQAPSFEMSVARRLIEESLPLLTWKRPRKIDVYSNMVEMDLGDITYSIVHDPYTSTWHVALTQRHALLPEPITVPVADIDKYLTFIDLVRHLVKPYSTKSTLHSLDLCYSTLEKLRNIEVPVKTETPIMVDWSEIAENQPKTIRDQDLEDMLNIDKAIIFDKLNKDEPILEKASRIVKELELGKGLGIIMPHCVYIDIIYPRDLMRIQLHERGNTLVISPRHLYLTSRDEENYDIYEKSLQKPKTVEYIAVYIPKDITLNEAENLKRKLEEIEKKLEDTAIRELRKEIEKKYQARFTYLCHLHSHK